MFRKATHIILDIAMNKGITVDELLSKGRSKFTVKARKEAIKKVRKETTLSMPEMARLFRYKDHTTILHHLKH